MAHSLYIHWPFCLRKCPYCDFNSHVRSEIDVDQWQNALLADMRFEAGLADEGPLQSIFFGGGTPSLMPPALVEALLQEAEQLWGFAAGIEITLEANPTSVESSRFVELANAGVNRVSLGIQSLNEVSLKFLGREHSVTEAIDALKIAHNNFNRVNFDLIYALPDQSENAWREELKTALEFGTDHLSLYQLTIEPGTRFASDFRTGKLVPVEDDRAAQLYDLTQEFTSEAGLPAYEISNHARIGEECRHNLTYWRYHDYCGIGPGAHGRRKGSATERHRKPENYLAACAAKGNGVKTATSLTPTDQACEALLMGLRLKEGVDLTALEQRFGLAKWSMVNKGALEQYGALGLVWHEGSRIGAQPKGLPVLNTLIEALIQDAMVAA
jgi:oxygen-independent coproporphyrinogen-3 oxidase